MKRSRVHLIYLFLGPVLIVLKTSITFVDLQQAYNNISISKLLGVLKHSVTNHTLISALQDLHKDSKSRVNFEKYLTEYIN